MRKNIKGSQKRYLGLILILILSLSAAGCAQDKKDTVGKAGSNAGSSSNTQAAGDNESTPAKGNNGSLVMNNDFYYSVKPIDRSFGKYDDGMRYSDHIIKVHGTGSFKNTDEFSSKSWPEQRLSVKIEAAQSGEPLICYITPHKSSSDDEYVGFEFRTEIPWRYQFENTDFEVEILVSDKSIGSFVINTQNDVKPLKEDINELSTNSVMVAGNEMAYTAMISKRYPLGGNVTRDKLYRLMILFETENVNDAFQVSTGADYYLVFKQNGDFKGYRTVYPMFFRIDRKTWVGAVADKNDNTTKSFLFSAPIDQEYADKISEVDLYVTTVDGTFKMTLPVEFLESDI